MRKRRKVEPDRHPSYGLSEYGVPLSGDDMLRMSSGEYVRVSTAMLSLFEPLRPSRSHLDALLENLEWIRCAMTQMDAGQRGSGADWDETWVRMGHVVVASMQLWMSGKLAELEFDEDDDDDGEAGE